MVRNLIAVFILILVITTSFAGCLEDSSDDPSDEGTDYFPPNISILSPKNNKQVSGTIEIEVSVYPAVDAIQLSFYVDETLVESSASTQVEWDTTTVENGQHLIEITALEIGGHVPAETQPAKTSVKVRVYNTEDDPKPENTPPTVTMKKPSGAIQGIHRGPVVVRGTVDDQEIVPDEIELQVEGESWIEPDEKTWFEVEASQGSWEYTLDPQSFTGEVLVRARAYDGSVSSEVETLTLTFDNTPPDIDVTDPEPDEEITGSHTLRTDIQDFCDIQYVTFTIDDVELENSTDPIFTLDTTEFENGEYELIVEAADIVGNYASIVRTFSIFNNEGPEAVISKPADGGEFEEEDEIIFDGRDSSDPDQDELTFVWVSDMDGQLSSEEYFMTTLSPGYHTITLTVSDPYDETGQAEVRITVTSPQEQAPEITISSPEDGSNGKDMITVEGTVRDVDEDLDTIRYRIDDGEWTDGDITGNSDEMYDWSFSFDSTQYEDGDRIIEVEAEDDEGNVDADSISLNFVNKGILVNIEEPANASYVSSVADIVVEVDADDPIDSISFLIGDDEVQNGTDEECSWDTTAFEDGEYIITVKAEDTSGRTGEHEITVTVDNTAPVVDIVSHDADDQVRETASIVAEAQDDAPMPIIEFSIDDEVIQEGGSLLCPWDTEPYDDGEHTMRVTVEDAAGNRGWTEVTVVVDNTKPTIEITDPDDGEDVGEDFLTILVDTSDDGGIASMDVLLDSILKGTDETEPYSVELDLRGFEDGDHTITAIARDIAGNTERDTITITIMNGEAPVISNPGAYQLTPYSASGKTRIVLKGENSEGVPLSSSLLGNRGITTSVEWSSSPPDELNVQETDPSLFSSRLALTYWTTPEVAIVVDSYENSLLAASLATFLDVPLLLYGDSTDEALWRLETIYANQILVLGNTPYNSHDGVTVLTKNTILQHTLTTASLLGRSINYLVVTFPGDDENMALDHEDNRDNYAPGISTFAPQFASYRGGLILTGEGNSVDARRDYLNETIKEWVSEIETAGFSIEYLLMHGDYYSLPMIHTSFTMTTVNGGTQVKLIPSDNWYLNKVGNPYQTEIAGGRTLAKSLPDMSFYIDRVVNYEDYLEGTTEPTVPEWTIYQPVYPMYKEWSNNALIYQGNAAEFAADSENAVRNMLHDDGHFHTLDDSSLAKECTNSGDAKGILMEDFAHSNFIAINADHGEPHACTLTFDSVDLLYLNPGVMFGVSCMLGQIDDTNHLAAGDDSEQYNVHTSNSMTYTLLEKGMNVFIGSTRTALGSFGTTTMTGMVDYQPYQAPGLCYLFYENLITHGMNTGNALKQAKIDLYSLNSDVGNRYSIWEYVHYGDPAFDPYVPCLDG